MESSSQGTCCKILVGSRIIFMNGLLYRKDIIKKALAWLRGKMKLWCTPETRIKLLSFLDAYIAQYDVCVLEGLNR